MSSLFTAFCFTKNVTGNDKYISGTTLYRINYNANKFRDITFKGFMANSESLIVPFEKNSIVLMIDLPNLSPLLTYTATVVSDSYISNNQSGQESFALAKRLKINQCEPLNNKHSSDKATFLNFVDLISQIQKGTPNPKTTYGELSSSTTNSDSTSQNTNQKIPSHATCVEDELIFL
ncbi:hypothetical protein F8M41_000030 [Gigaspora margarita]|uniref:Uncharacterized protein n=1 Tax=Gigaspora margarita TaxID=4874 RepID=A0A8H4B5Z6_GIGMA|nr:hypothetical protein F8M41_000030 [Gigaspora margarita]